MNDIRRIFVAIMLCAFVSVGSFAMTDDWAMTIHLANGTTVECDFTKLPEMTFDKGTIVLTSKGVQSYTWKFSEVDNWTFGLIEGINDSQEKGALINISDNALLVTAKPETEVIVYGVDGKVVKLQKVDATGELSMKLSEFNKGIYVLKLGTSAFKFQVK